MKVTLRILAFLAVVAFAWAITIGLGAVALGIIGAPFAVLNAAVIGLGVLCAFLVILTLLQAGTNP